MTKRLEDIQLFLDMKKPSGAGEYKYMIVSVCVMF
jgi:hypothetical protein